MNIGLRKIYQDNIGKLNNQVNRAMLLEKLNKAQKSYNSDYTYRVYKEEEINKLVEPKKESEDAPISENVGDDLT